MVSSASLGLPVGGKAGVKDVVGSRFVFLPFFSCILFLVLVLGRGVGWVVGWLNGDGEGKRGQRRRGGEWMKLG